MPGRARASCLILTEGEHHAQSAEALRAGLEAMGMGAEVFPCRSGADARERLLWAYQRLGGGCLAAFGGACAQALALSIQLPVERAALLWPWMGCGGGWPEGFVRRDLALCAADLLCVNPRRDLLRRLKRQLPPGRVSALAVDGDAGENPWIKCEFSVKYAVCRFLLTGDHGKSLAENPEMCIIYR